MEQRTKELREAKQMSQKDLAYSSDLGSSYIAGIETGHRNISVANNEKIAVGLGATLKELFNAENFENITTNKS